MKKSLIATILCVLCLSSLFAQNNNEKSSVVQISFFPPLSTNGREAKEYTNGGSFNILWGFSKNDKYFSFGGLGNTIGNNAGGLQFAGLYNVIGNNANGLQFAGITNIIGNHSNGLQFAGLVNVTGENSNGMQFAGLINITGESAKGLQFGGLTNIVGESFRGIQFGGLLNITGESTNGMQFAGLGNVSGEAVRGVQFAGLMNVAPEVTGLQLGGLLNVAKEVKGVQFGGIMNVAKDVKGLQFGLINYAENSDYSIGVINIIKNGERSIGLTYDNMGSIVASYRSGGRIMYGILGLGYNYETDDEPLVIEAGFGAHIPLVDRFRINTELKSQWMTSFSDTQVNKYALSILPAFRIIPQLEVYAGPNINYMDTDNVKNLNMFPGGNIWKKYRDDKLQQVFIGFEAGLQWIF